MEKITLADYIKVLESISNNIKQCRTITDEDLGIEFTGVIVNFLRQADNNIDNCVNILKNIERKNKN